MSVRILSVVQISIMLLTVLAGCGGSKQENSNSGFSLTNSCITGKIAHLGHCYDSIHISDENIGFRLKSKSREIIVSEFDNKEWLDSLVPDDIHQIKGQYSNIYYYTASNDAGFFTHLTPMMGWVETPDGKKRIDFLSIRLALSSNENHLHWKWLEGSIKMNGRIYTLPINFQHLKDAYQGKLDPYDDGVGFEVLHRDKKISFLSRSPYGKRDESGNVEFINIIIPEDN